MKVLVIGSGGREHALVWKIAQSPHVHKIFCTPGNAGIQKLAECSPIRADDIGALKNFALKNKIDLTIVGPELPLSLGIVDEFEKNSLSVFGPAKNAANLESSKIFAKNLMKEHRIPTADFAVFHDAASAEKYVRKKNAPVVIKADGLAAGKGVFPSKTVEEALAAIDRIMVKKEFGSAGESIIIEEFLSGEEASFICFTDGKTVLPMPSTQDHKPIFDCDRGPNTGGMGAYSPAPVISPELHTMVMKQIMYPAVQAMASRGTQYKGVLYAGLMIEQNKPKVLEFNVRFGDPETQPLMVRLETDLIEIINATIHESLETIDPKWDSRAAVCVVMASAGYPGKYKKGIPIQGLQDAEQVKDTVIFHAGTSCKDGQIVTNGGRVLGVTSLGDTIDDAIRIAYIAAQKIYWDGAHFRKDIGKKAVNR